MKTKLNIIIILILTSSCCTQIRTSKAYSWINTHPKPIITYSHKYNSRNLNLFYTFIDSAGTVYYAGEINGTLPDTINQLKH